LLGIAGEARRDPIPRPNQKTFQRPGNQAMPCQIAPPIACGKEHVVNSKGIASLLMLQMNRKSMPCSITCFAFLSIGIIRRIFKIIE
jgi:hypothetical protein